MVCTLPRTVSLLVVCSLALSTNTETPAQPSRPTDVLWIEGEDASQTNVTPHSWYDSVKKDVLSGKQWLSHFDENSEGSAAYEFEIEQSDRYVLWVRANPVVAKMSFRFDAGDWRPINFDRHQRGLLNIAQDDKPDLRFIAWVKVGSFELNEGSHSLVFRMHSGPQNHGGIDCLVLTRIPFVPSGANKPQLRPKPAEPDDWFPVVMDEDPLSPNSVIDVSHLVEAPAGKYGFLKRNGDALQFEQADEPSKFWAVNATVQRGWDDRQMQQAARWYRKHGINLVRQHTVINAVGLLDDEGRFDVDRMDQYDRWFAHLKREGIYSTWSVVYPHHGRFLRKSDGVDAALFAELDQADEVADGRRQPIAVNDFINLDRDLQAAAWKYFDALLHHVNPHTQLAYKDDPALAVIEFQNESNVFFYTLNALLEDAELPILSRRMRQQFFRFVEKKYGSRDAVAVAWKDRWQAGDDWESGELRLMGPHHWGADGPQYEYAGQTRRAGDYIQWLTQIQRDYYERRERQLRQAGFRGVTVATAWRSGGPAASMANLYADTAADMIDRHNYFGGGDGRHVIVEGHVNNDTHLRQPGRGLLNLGLFQVAGRPFGASELLQMAPNPWKAEAAPLCAFYGVGLQGWDAVYSFALGSRRMGDGWRRLGKYVVETPHYLGQFPALAFAVHRRHLKEADVVAARHVSQSEIFSGRDSLGQSLSGGGTDEKQLSGRLSTPPWALAIGRVTIAFDDAPSDIRDLSPFHDEPRETIVSSTGELVWRYGDRIVEVRSPKTQAIIGFAGGKKVRLPAVEVDVGTPFVSLIFTPLDDRDLEDSRRILITAMARDQQTGTRYNADYSELLNVGGPPLLMEPVQATIRFAGDRVRQVRPLDFYGVPKDHQAPVDDDSLQIDGRYRTYYYEVLR